MPLIIDYDRPVLIADGVFWVGFCDRLSGLHCNPYLIVDQGEAVLIDGGSRPDFPVVMMKILQTGILPDAIKALIFQHYDPDLCGSVTNFEDIIANPNLKIISAQENEMFIRHYSCSTPLTNLEQLNYRYTFTSGRELYFVKTPYAHAPGSFVTFDKNSGVLFSSDLFGSYDQEWDLFVDIPPECLDCSSFEKCPRQLRHCFIPGILNFHKANMPCVAALRLALEKISEIDFKMIAPQHGGVIKTKDGINTLISHLKKMNDIGIDGILQKPQDPGR